MHASRFSTSSYTAVRNHSVNVSSSTQVPPQLAAGASHSNCSSHARAPHATENLFSIDQLFYGTHSRMTYNHSRIVNHFAMLSRTTTNHINLPQQKTFTYHFPLPFLNLHSRNYFLTTSRWRPPRSGFFPVGESLNIINSIQFKIGFGWLRSPISINQESEDNIELLPLYHVPCVTLCTLSLSCQTTLTKQQKKKIVRCQCTTKLTQVSSFSESHKGAVKKICTNSHIFLWLLVQIFFTAPLSHPSHGRARHQIRD